METTERLVFREPWWALGGNVLLYALVPLGGIAAAVLIGWWGVIAAVALGAPGVLLVSRTASARTELWPDETRMFALRRLRVTPRDHVAYAVQRRPGRPPYLVHQCGGGELLGSVATRKRIDADWWEQTWGAAGVPLLDAPPEGRTVQGRPCEFANTRRWPGRWEWVALAAYVTVAVAVAGAVTPVFAL